MLGFSANVSPTIIIAHSHAVTCLCVKLAFFHVCVAKIGREKESYFTMQVLERGSSVIEPTVLCGYLSMYETRYRPFLPCLRGKNIK